MAEEDIPLAKRADLTSYVTKAELTSLLAGYVGKTETSWVSGGQRRSVLEVDGTGAAFYENGVGGTSSNPLTLLEPEAM